MTTLNETEELTRYARRNLWLVLLLVLLLGVWAVASVGLAGADAAAFAARMAIVLPVFIVIAAVALKPKKGVNTDPAGPAMKAMLNDELREASLNRACRNGFLSVLMVQPLLAFAPTWVAITHPAALMACLTVVTGVVVALATMLYYDR